MNVLSLFDGKSSGYTALELAGFEVVNYYSAEIDKYAIQVSNAIHPNQIRLGDVTKWREWDIDFASIDLLLGGFPCQAWSMAGKKQGDKDERGMLFWTTLDIFKHVQQLNPSVKFLLENVKMKKEFEQYITHHTEQALGHVHKTLINSALVSAQNRQRYYWTNFPVTQPDDRGIMLIDVLEEIGSGWIKNHGEWKLRDEKSGTLTTVQKDNLVCKRIDTVTDVRGHDCIRRVYSPEGKAPTLTTMGGGHREPKVSIKPSFTGECLRDIHYRKLTPRECFRLQTVPEHLIDKILACGEVYSHCQNFYNDLSYTSERREKCKSVKSMTVSNQSQAEKLNCAISTTLGTLGLEQLKRLGILSIKANHVKRKGATVTARLQKDCASSVTKHGKESTTSPLKNVRFVLKMSEAGGVDCVLDTQNQKQSTEILTKLTLTKEENLNLTETKVSNILKIQTVDGLIGLSLRKLLEESSEKEKQFITLMAINLIIARSIFLFANLTHNTYLCIDSLSRLQCDSLEMAISTLKMENIKPISNSALYKIAGNGWTDEVIAHIFNCMFIDYRRKLIEQP